MIRTLIALALAGLLAGCNTLNSAGIGGEPKLLCSFRTGKAVLDDRIAGTDRVSVTVARAFADGDQLCLPLKAARAASSPSG